MESAALVIPTVGGRVLPAAECPSAIFAVTDRAATGVQLAAGRLGLRAPEELSVVGFDDQEQLAAHVVPALTTLALPHRVPPGRARVPSCGSGRYPSAVGGTSIPAARLARA